jgi:hypothetical protein
MVGKLPNPITQPKSDLFSLLMCAYYSTFSDADFFKQWLLAFGYWLLAYLFNSSALLTTNLLLKTATANSLFAIGFSLIPYLLSLFPFPFSLFPFPFSLFAIFYFLMAFPFSHLTSHISLLKARRTDPQRQSAYSSPLGQFLHDHR